MDLDTNFDTHIPVGQVQNGKAFSLSLSALGLISILGFYDRYLVCSVDPSSHKADQIPIIALQYPKQAETSRRNAVTSLDTRSFSMSLFFYGG